MKILILQLTRFGDILCTLPVISAVRRERPDCEIHFMARKRFAGAVEGCRAIDHFWRFDTAAALGPIINGTGTVFTAGEYLSRLVAELRAQKFDQIINLSFSPSSSYITHLISRDAGTPVLGYTRTSDFYLHVPDAPGAYFRSQVGLDKSNRIHVSDLMAMVAGVTLKEMDWRDSVASPEMERRSGIVCHLGASRSQKTWPAAYWVTLIKRIISELREPVTLIGSADERALADSVTLQVGGERAVLKNHVGETDFPSLYDEVRRAKLFIGADSGPMHVAGRTGTRVLNLSVGDVRFWETGPVTIGSRVLVSFNPDHLSSERVYAMTAEMIRGENSREGYIECVSPGGIRYMPHTSAEMRRDYWELVEWLYFGALKPRVSGEIVTALKQICEVCELAGKQLEVFFKEPQKTEVVGVLDRLDEILVMFSEHIKPLAPMMGRFLTAKENIPPGTREEIFYRTKSCYTDLHRMAAGLLGEGAQEKGKSA